MAGDMKRLSSCNRRAAHEAGVTLLELLVVVTIVGILAAIAFPSYQNYVLRTNRSAAKSCLSEYAQFMERYYTTNLTYVGAVPSPSCKTDSNLDLRYTFATSNLGQKTYSLSATPVGAQTKDTKCGTLGIDQDGARSVSVSGGLSYCW
jgi:type IV pilus assembly protein PilE